MAHCQEHPNRLDLNVSYLRHLVVFGNVTSQVVLVDQGSFLEEPFYLNQPLLREEI